MKCANEEGWRFVAFVRLVPLFPFNILNYALGLTKIRSYHYIAATFICMAPGAFAHTYLGYTGREVAGDGEELITKGLLAASLLVALALLPGLVKRFFHIFNTINHPKTEEIISTKELSIK